MIERVHVMRPRAAAEEPEDTDAGDRPALASLRFLTAQLLLATGTGATLRHLRNHPSEAGDADRYTAPGEEDSSGGLQWPRVATWAPALVGSVAAAAQIAHALRPSDATRAAVRVLNGAVLGAGAADLAHSLYRSSTKQSPVSLAPLSFGLTGALGFLLDHEEQATEAEIRRLERRASVVDRWVPRRRTRLDRVVVHV